MIEKKPSSRSHLLISKHKTHQAINQAQILPYQNIRTTPSNASIQSKYESLNDPPNAAAAHRKLSPPGPRPCWSGPSDGARGTRGTRAGHGWTLGRRETTVEPFGFPLPVPCWPMSPVFPWPIFLVKVSLVGLVPLFSCWPIFLVKVSLVGRFS